MTPQEHARVLISTVHPSPGPDRLIEITGLAKKRKPVKRYFTDAQLAADFSLEINTQGYAAFHGVNPHGEFAGFESSIPCVTSLVLDLQPERTDIAGVYAAMSAHGIPPTITACSGNGAHVYVLLSEEADPYKAKPVAERLVLATGSDRIFNTNRILGITGTVNWKNPPTWRYLTSVRQERYTLAEVESALDRMGAPHPRKHKEGIPVPVEAPVSWSQLYGQLPESVRDIIITGERNPYSDRQISRSEADWLVVCTLVRAGVSDEMIHWIYETQPVGIMKYREAGARYLNHTIDTARRATATNREFGSSSHLHPAQYNGGARDQPKHKKASVAR